MCDRISIILGGRIIARGTVAELQALAGSDDPQLTPVFLKLTGGGGLQEIEIVTQAFPWLLLPVFWSARNRARRRERGDGLRAALFGGLGLGVAAAIFAVVFWLTWQLLDYEELGDYLVRLGLSWLFLTFLSFLAFSALVTSLSTFFLSEDLRLLLAAPVPPERLFHSRFARTVGQSAWMVVAFLLPVLLALGLARCAPAGYYVLAVRHRRALRRDPVRPRGDGHARPGQRLPRPARPRPPDADGTAVRGRHRDAAALHPARAAAQRPVAAGRHRLLRHAAVAGDAAPALVLGGREPVRGPCAGRSTPCTWGRCGRPPSRSPSSPGPLTGGTTSPPGARPRRPARRASRASPSSSPSSAGCPSPRRVAPCWSRT